jgi:hypothetical protein
MDSSGFGCAGHRQIDREAGPGRASVGGRNGATVLFDDSA